MGAVKTLAKREIVSYDEDILLWSQQQAQLLREGRFAELDIEHLADEIEDVGNTEKRELASRFTVLLAHLLKWLFQPDHRCNSWQGTIRLQRERLALALKETPSLKSAMREKEWQKGLWIDAILYAETETGLTVPRSRPFTLDQALDPDFWPE